MKSNILIDDIELKNFVNLNENEIELVRIWRNHTDVRKWMYTDHEISKEEHLNFIENLKKDTKNFYYLLSKDQKYIGVISLSRLSVKNRNAYFGIYANPLEKVPNAGIILEKASLKLAFEVANLHTLKLEVVENNERALRFYKRMGFKEEGRLKEFVFKEGSWLDVIVMGITEEEYRENKNRRKDDR
ncbi:MAG: UDP-4-amino-4,6-dideoxy-N-acetyl-beta-L-altrosamine N-acetyltransferase [Fervidicoccus sp.]